MEINRTTNFLELAKEMQYFIEGIRSAYELLPEEEKLKAKKSIIDGAEDSYKDVTIYLCELILDRLYT